MTGTEKKSDVTLARALVAEALGSALLTAAVLGSGIMAQRLAHDPAVALLCNSLATAGALVALLLVFGPISGAHLNPAVTLVLTWTREVSPRRAGGYLAVQLIGCILGAILANTMFGLPAVTWATTVRSGGSIVLSDAVATFGLIAVVIAVGRSRPEAGPYAVAAYITAGYWYTASTSFANPAMTIARMFTDTYGGTRPVDVPALIGAQLAGAALGAVVFGWLFPRRA